MNKLYLFWLSLFFSATVFSQCAEPGENPGDTGCISLLYAGSQTTYATVRAADGTIWLQQNLGSAAIATSATDTDAYGDLFQWGRWDDGHQSRTSQLSSTLLTPNNPLGLNGGIELFYTTTPEWWKNGAPSDKWDAINPQTVSANTGCDPCKALGEHWQMPTPEEWQSMIDAENITNVASAFQSNLKLTVAGSRSSSGISNAGIRGYYWSRTPSDNATFAKYLYYSNFIVNTTAGGFREQGSSVRCIMSAAAYCAVGVDFDVEPITSVVFADIHNTGPATVNATPAFENFTAQVAHVNKGESYALAVKGNTVGLEHDIRVFIDWNNDKIFDMGTEYYTASLSASTGEDAVEATFEIEIPENAELGNTRMRIIKDMWNVYEEGEFDACLNAYYGQIEEYTIDIQETLGTGNTGLPGFRIYPNPVADLLTVQSGAAIKSIEIYNSLGQLLVSQTSNDIQLAKAAAGIYVVKITFENGQTATQKIIKK